MQQAMKALHVTERSDTSDYTKAQYKCSVSLQYFAGTKVLYYES